MLREYMENRDLDQFLLQDRIQSKLDVANNIPCVG